MTAALRTKIQSIFSQRLITEGMSDRYTAPPPHPVPESARKYIDTMSEKELSLHLLAMELLGSSYFVETSHGFVKWQDGQVKHSSR